MATFLLEIGTEELPADFARLVLGQLEPMVRRDLAEQRLSFDALHCTSTPRRIALQLDGLADAAEDLQEERKGPPAGQAFKDGEPTKAAIGFAQRCGLDPKQLEIRDTPKGPFVFAAVLERGRSSRELLSELIPTWLSALQGRRFMRWGAGERRFSRPIRWLVALLDAEVVPVSLPGSDPAVEAGNRSCGHRLIAPSVTIPHAEQYRQVLAEAGVQVERQQRRSWISEAVAGAAKALEARADLPDELLEELTDLVERPSLLEGSVDGESLDLPAEVLSTVMRAHQRYVPLYNGKAEVDPLALQARGTLLPQFLCIANGLDAAAASIRRGNERVLKARLADVAFFVNADRAVSSGDRREQLARVTFAEGLGSLRDRCERLEWLAQLLASELKLAAETGAHSIRAAHLCKHDLVSQMVGEFPELQGLMGGKYLLEEGEPRDVALAVVEHYLPRGAGDALPATPAGAVVALAERLELLLSIFAKGERPTGSSDPYALRRAGNGVVQILWGMAWRLDLMAFLSNAVEEWAALFPAFAVDASQLHNDLCQLMRQRIVSQLEDDGFAPDLVQAVAGDAVSSQRLLSDPLDVKQRIQLLRDLRDSGQLDAVQAVVQRAAKLAEKGDLARDQLVAGEVVEAERFESASEKDLFAALEQLQPLAQQRSYQALADALVAATPALQAFFDGETSVMVMVDDSALRLNRLNLLAVLRNQASVLAEFESIQSK